MSSDRHYVSFNRHFLIVMIFLTLSRLITVIMRLSYPSMTFPLFSIFQFICSYPTILLQRTTVLLSPIPRSFAQGRQSWGLGGRVPPILGWGSRGTQASGGM